METSRLADLHAYVDECLGPEERRAFENQIADNPALARRVATWRAQNSAIRAAFQGEGAKAFSISAARRANESLAKGRRPAPDVGRQTREQAFPFPSPDVTNKAQTAAKSGALGRFRLRANLRFGLAALSVCLACAWPSREPAGADRLGEFGVAAFNAFARPGIAPVEFPTNDIEDLRGWLASRLPWTTYIPRSPGLDLIGARIAPASDAAAAFLVYRTAEGPVGLLVQALDAAPSRPPELERFGGRDAAVWTSGGQGFALVGDIGAASLLTIATVFFDAEAPPAQPMPDRGS
jgi:anti-sigma factor RsiW